MTRRKETEADFLESVLISFICYSWPVICYYRHMYEYENDRFAPSDPQTPGYSGNALLCAVLSILKTQQIPHFIF